MLDTAFILLGASVTWLEVWAFVLALGCVACNVYEIHWGWPLAIASSLLYAWLFSVSKLYGEGALQVFFAATSVWGWWQWLFGKRKTRGGAATRLAVSTLGGAGRAATAVLWLVAWPATGVLLAHTTDTDVPFLDAFPTVGSVIGQILLGRKFIETWAAWVIVNVVSVGVFVYKDLLLTAALYLIFAGLAVVGWVRWARTARGS